jgi:hypothetical protein
MPIPVQTADEDNAEEAVLRARIEKLETETAASHALLRQFAQAILDIVPEP